MVSLKKEPVIREVTPVHLMDEQEAVRKYCPQRETSDIEITVKQADADLLPAVKEEQADKPAEKTFCGLDKWDWFDAILKTLLATAGLALATFIFAGLLGEGFSLIRLIFGS